MDTDSHEVKLQLIWPFELIENKITIKNDCVKEPKGVLDGLYMLVREGEFYSTFEGGFKIKEQK